MASPPNRGKGVIAEPISLGRSEGNHENEARGVGAVEVRAPVPDVRAVRQERTSPAGGDDLMLVKVAVGDSRTAPRHKPRRGAVLVDVGQVEE